MLLQVVHVQGQYAESVADAEGADTWVRRSYFEFVNSMSLSELLMVLNQLRGL